MQSCLISRANGKTNTKFQKFMLDFFLMLCTFGKRVYIFVAANLPGVSLRHIQRITAKTSINFILDFSFDGLNSRLNKIYDTMPGTKKLVVSVSMDATKVIPALLSCLKFNCIVGIIYLQ